MRRWSWCCGLRLCFEQVVFRHYVPDLGTARNGRFCPEPCNTRETNGLGKCAELLGDGARERGLVGAGVKCGGGLDECDPGLFFGGGVVARAARDYKELTGKNGHGAAVCIGASDAEVAPEDEEHLVFVVVRVPGKLSLDLCHFDVLVVDLT